ncbi:hypothetical protein [Streptomyces boninensis]|uniref:hypothetical protein n=1 Tax=Streptomyces boninensis TaxID=2039455 RepID=UPI003B2180B2
MRRFFRIALVLLMAPLIGFALAVPALAGGPTSVALINGGSTQATALYASSRAYAELSRYIGESANDTHQLAKTPPRSALGGQEGRQITATWLIHDVQVWRVDRIYLDTRDGRPLIQRTVGEPTDASPEVTWRAAADSEGLLRVLARLKVDGKSTDEGRTAPDFPALHSGSGTGGTPAAAPVKRAAAPDTDPATGWWWAVPGAATGALLVWGALRRRPRTAGRDDSRWELLDVSEQDEQAPDGPDARLSTPARRQATGSPGAG